MIQDYSFGRISIGDQVYTNDIIVYPNSVEPDWWRDQGHLLQEQDLTEILEFKPEFLVIGTGANGAMTVPKQLKKSLQAQTRLIAAQTPQAIEEFNQLLAEDKKVVGAFHLTC